MLNFYWYEVLVSVLQNVFTVRNFVPDFVEEREIFWFEILPELQNHCLQYGSDILLYDPFQGKENDPVYQPHLTQQLLRQIQECRSQSEGVFFVVSFLSLK